MNKDRHKINSIKAKLLIPVAVQLLSLVIFLIVIAFSVYVSRKNLQETSFFMQAADQIKIIREIAVDHFYTIIPSQDRINNFHKAIDNLNNTYFEGNSKSIENSVKYFDTISELKKRNIEIEKAIIKESGISITQSNSYIEQTVSRLTNPAQANAVSDLEKMVIIGANINTSSNLAIQKLFYQMAYDPSAKDELFSFINTAMNNAQQDAERLADTPFSQMPAAALESNKRISGFLNEYVANIGKINTANNNNVLELLEIEAELNGRVSDNQVSTYNTVNAAFLIIAILIVFTSAVIAGLNYAIGLKVSKSMRRVVDVLKNISEGEGDLTIRIDASSRDETGDMGRYFNLTIEKIGAMIASIKNESRNLKNVGEDLSSHMTETAAAVNEITANIESVKNQIVNQSASVTETQATVESIVKNVADLNEQIETQSSAVIQSTSSIEEMVANIRSVTSSLEHNSNNMKELSDASEKGKSGMENVSELVKTIAEESAGLLETNRVIQNIAGQTNLLSMNAAIEAAHAGEYGKGFAVVADEIRKLAENAGIQSRSISEVLKGVTNLIDMISNATENALKGFEHVTEVVKVVNDQELSIKNAMAEQSVGGTQVLEALTQINQITSQVRDGSSQMLNAGSEIREEMGNLFRVTHEISQSMDEMTTGTSEINIAVTHVAEITGRNRDSVNTLIDEVARFKVLS